MRKCWSPHRRFGPPEEFQAAAAKWVLASRFPTGFKASQGVALGLPWVQAWYLASIKADLGSMSLVEVETAEVARDWFCRAAGSGGESLDFREVRLKKQYCLPRLVEADCKLATCR